MLNISHTLQIGYDCVVASIETVTKYLGKPYDGRIMIRHKYYDKGIVFALSGVLLRQAGYRVKIYCANLSCLSSEEYLLPSNEIIKLLNDREKEFEGHGLKMLKAIREAVESGVELVFMDPNLETIDEYIDKKIPVVLVVNVPSLYLVRGDVYAGHAVVLCGKDNGVYQIADSRLEQIQNFSERQLLFGIYGRKQTDVTGWLMEIGL